MDYKPLSQREELIGKAIVNSAYKVHHALGPGLLERVYEVCLSHELQKNGFEVKRQTDIPINYDGIAFMEGLRLDMVIDDLVIIELKAVELMNPVYEAQIISYLKMTRLRLGYLINFNVPLIRDGIQRFRM
jgi:GxxExxY protein